MQRTPVGRPGPEQGLHWLWGRRTVLAAQAWVCLHVLPRLENLSLFLGVRDGH